MTTRTDIVKMLSENRDVLEANLHEVWRRQAEDLMAAGVPAHEVSGSMVAVALTQEVLVHGTTQVAETLRRQLELIELAAEHGVERPAPEVRRLDS